MKIIDAFTGKPVLPGQVLIDPHGKRWRLVRVERKGLLGAEALIEFPDVGGEPIRVPLTVRLMHPKYLFQLVGFVPT